MKKLTLLLISCVISMTVLAQNNAISAYTNDNSGSATNIRCAPKGEVAMTIDSDNQYMLLLSNPQDGWWQVEDIYDPTDEDNVISLKGSKTGKYFIHYSIVGFTTRNYGSNYSMREKPSKKSKAVYTFFGDIFVHPIEVKGDWVKVKTGDMKHTGWIESVMICDNPLTTCP